MNCYITLLPFQFALCEPVIIFFLPHLFSVFIPLSEVQKEWREHRGLEHLHTVGLHDNIFTDIFNGEFRPRGFLRITYGDSNVIHHGNLLTPGQTSDAPQVQLPQEMSRGEGYASLLLTNPDGHLRDSTLQVLHWMM